MAPIAPIAPINHAAAWKSTPSKCKVRDNIRHPQEMPQKKAQKKRELNSRSVLSKNFHLLYITI